MRCAVRLLVLLLIIIVPVHDIDNVAPTNIGLESISSIPSFKQYDAEPLVLGTESIRFSDGEPNYVLRINKSDFYIVGDYEKFILLKNEEIYSAPQKPPVPYKVIELNGYYDVQVVSAICEKIYLGKNSLMPKKII